MLHPESEGILYLPSSGEDPIARFHVGLLADAWCLLLVSGCGGGGGGGGAPAPEEVVAVDPSDYTGPDGTDLRGPINSAFDENEPTPAEDEDVPGAGGEEFGPPSTFTADTLIVRGATFNSYLMGVKKAMTPVDPDVAPVVGAPAGDPTGKIAYRLMADQHIHVLGVQEVMLNRLDRVGLVAGLLKDEQAAQHAFLGTTTEGPYVQVTGMPVHQWHFTFPVPGGGRIRFQRTEYCPIVYDSNVLTCGGSQVSPIDVAGPTTTIRRSAHSVDCSVRSIPAQSFRFYCAHLPADKTRNLASLAIVQFLLTSAPRVMIAADFNSNPTITESGIGARWQNVLNAVGAMYHQPQGDYTKLSIRNGLAQWRAEAVWRYLDDVLWSGSLEPLWVAPKKTITFNKSLPADQDWLLKYIKSVSDHFVVAADFRFWTGAP